MTIAEILNSVKFVVEPDGSRAAAVDMETWEQIVVLLEDAKDAEEETISWKNAEKALNLGE
ncbi:MAG: hypothetical protein HND47_13510 [Chloroflexi bacterium]|nr:hypothetical protein [Chloroflexota bacterium]